MSEAKTDAVLTVSLNEAITFSAPVDSLFFSQLIAVSSKWWGAEKVKPSLLAMEAISRAAALLEAVFKGKIVVVDRIRKHRAFSERDYAIDDLVMPARTLNRDFLHKLMRLCERELGLSTVTFDPVTTAAIHRVASLLQGIFTQKIDIVGSVNTQKQDKPCQSESAEQNKEEVGIVYPQLNFPGYVVVEETDLERFSEKMSLLVERGYQCCGGLLVEHVPSTDRVDGYTIYRQAAANYGFTISPNQ